jgi:hypothetical protein
MSTKGALSWDSVPFLADQFQMLQYYESHLVFTQNDGLNGDDTSMKDVY